MVQSQVSQMDEVTESIGQSSQPNIIQIKLPQRREVAEALRKLCQMVAGHSEHLQVCEPAETLGPF